MNNEKDWLEALSDERAAIDPVYAANVQKADMMVELLTLRKKLNYTQEDVATKLGVSRALVARMESRPSSASLDQFARYAAVVGARLVLEVPKVKATAA